jgi:hypothetical protein
MGLKNRAQMPRHDDVARDIPPWHRVAEGQDAYQIEAPQLSEASTQKPGLTVSRNGIKQHKTS